MRLGKVKVNLNLEYVVDLDSHTMVEHAETWLEEDMKEIIKDIDKLGISAYIEHEEDKNASFADIHSGLVEHYSNA